MNSTAVEIEKLKQLSEANSNSNYISIYTSKKQQNLSNIPILKPLLIIILSGCKVIGNKTKLACNTGDFIFFTDVQSMNMRNIPANTNYFALLIDFEFSDFNDTSININPKKNNEYTAGKVNPALYKCISQMIECLEWASDDIITNRRKEIIKLLVHSGYENLACLPNRKETTQKVIEIFNKKDNKKITIDEICKEICMSKATLYRKLKLEGENIQKIKEKLVMGQALHLLQTSNFSTEYIAEMIGYSSSTRFSQRFKANFGLTPRELKNTKRN